MMSNANSITEWHFIELLICKEEVDELRKKCNAVVAQIEDISMLKQCMSTLWQHVSYKNIR